MRTGSRSKSCGPCGACKLLRRKCVAGCIFAPYFDSEQGGVTQFARVHKVFGASNVSKLLDHVPQRKRGDAVATICFEAQARLIDPIYGSCSHILFLHQQVINLQAEISYLRLQSNLASQQVPQAEREAEAAAASGSSIWDVGRIGASSVSVSVGSVYEYDHLPSIFETSSASWGIMEHEQQPNFGVPNPNPKPWGSKSNNVGGDKYKSSDDDHQLQPLPPQLSTTSTTTTTTTTTSLIKPE